MDIRLEAAPAPPPTKRRVRRFFIALLCWLYLLSLVGLMAVIRLRGDQTWPVTLVLFSPRWAVLLPLVILLPLALWGNRRMLIVLAASIIVAVFPLMGFCVGWHRIMSPATDGLAIRIVAFNVHHQDLTDPAIARFFAGANPDVVTLEELPPVFNRELFPAGRWHVHQEGELFIASRFPIVSAASLFHEDFAASYQLRTPAGPLNLIVVHLSSPHYGLRDTIKGTDHGREDLILNIHERADESARLDQLTHRSPLPLIVAGDFNLLFDSQLFTSHFSSLTDSFTASGLGFGWTYLNDWTAVRIDHVLSNNGLDSRACMLGPYLGSPHRPVIADLVLRKIQ